MPDFGERLDAARQKEEELGQRRRDKELSRRRKIIRTTETPVMPSLCRGLFICMIGLAALGAGAEMIAAIRSGGQISPLEAASAGVISVLVIWVILAAAVVLLSVIQLIRIRRGHQEMEYFFYDEIPEDVSRWDLEPLFDEEQLMDEQLQLYRRPVPGKPEKKYQRYILISMAGAVILCAAAVVFA